MIVNIFRKALRIEAADKKVDIVKRRFARKMNEAVVELEKAGRVNRSVMKKTTTFYLCKAVGAIK